MIEEGRFPFGAVVAVCARRTAGPGELSAMDVLVAILTFRWCGLEIYVDQPGLLVGRFVAIHASRGAVRALQGKRSLRVIEPCQLFPGLG